MKNLKTTIGLSVLALACLGAGALSVKPTVSAYAEETVTTLTVDQLRTYGRAEICVSEGYNGIRWESRIAKGFPYVDSDGIFMENVYRATDDNGAVATNGAGATFGVLVAPTGSFGEELTMEDVTEDGKGAMKLGYEEGALDTTSRVIFYTVINYDELATDLKQDAYALNLTARTYMYFQDKYYYGTQEDNSRSARSLAINAEIDGTLDGYRNSGNAEKEAMANKAVEYYGGTQVSLGDKSKHYIDDTVTLVADKEAFATNGSVELALDLGETTSVEAIVGYESLEATYADGTLTITDFGSVADGEHYLTVFTDNGPVVKPLITATKVLTSIEDFEMFWYIKTNVNSSGKMTYTIQEGIEETRMKLSGYYVLGNNVGATKDKDGNAYTKTTGSASSWAGVANFVDTGLGLTGTFNGMGYAVDGYTETYKYSAFFELINGGTVKNFALTNYKTTSRYNMAIAYFAINPVIENVYVEMSEATYGHGLFAYIYQTEEKAAKFNNVFVNSTFDGTYANISSLTFKISGTKNVDWSYASFDATNAIVVSNAVLNFTSTDDTITCISKYDDLTTFKNAVEAGTHDLTAFTASGCWTVVDGVPVWASMQQAQE